MPADATEPAPHPWEAPGLACWERVILFCESLPVTAGKLAGTPWRARRWQRRWIKRVFRTDRKGRRIVRTAVLSVARKNGKTDLAARLSLAAICGPISEPRGEVYTAANDKAQAAKIFKEMCAIIARVPWMKARINVVRHSKELEDLEEAGGTGTFYAALSADVPTKMGLSPSFYVYDELGSSRSRDLLDALDTATGARDEPLGLIISTQAARDDAPMSELIDHGLKAQRGELKDSTFDLELWSADPALDPWDPKTWRLANPALGDFRSLEDVKRLAAQAQNMPSREASFRNLILNQRVDPVTGFLSAAVWKRCLGTVDLTALKGRPCYAALDLSGSRDLTSLTLLFTEGPDGKIDVLQRFWLPADDLDEAQDRDNAPYLMWRDQTYLSTSPGKTIDPKVIALAVAELHAEYGFRVLAYDAWRIEDLKRELDAIGCDVETLPHGQGFKDMSYAVNELERLVFEEQLRTGGNPVLTWCVANTKIETDPAGNRKPSKSRSTGRIDGCVTLCMAAAMITRAPPPRRPSVYETRGLLTVDL